MRYLAIFSNEDASNIHLYKDVGGIPYALAKYNGVKSTLLYNGINGEIIDDNYSLYVKLVGLKFPIGKDNVLYPLLKYCIFLSYVAFYASRFDVLNCYHITKMSALLCLVAKLRNPAIITYIKLDMSEQIFCDIKKRNVRIKDKIWKFVDLFSVETKYYYNELSTHPIYKGKLLYIPNGFFREWYEKKGCYTGKRNEFITVGRIGSTSKHSEMLVKAIEHISEEEIGDWKFIFIGPIKQKFKDWYEIEEKNNPVLKKSVVFKGEVTDKDTLIDYYRRSKVFILTSRWESWGLVVTEAMAAGNYLLLTDCSRSFRERVITGESGFATFVDVGDFNALSLVIRKIISGEMNIDRSNEKAKKMAFDNYDWKVIVNNLYKKIVTINNDLCI